MGRPPGKYRCKACKRPLHCTTSIGRGYCLECDRSLHKRNLWRF